MTERRNQFGQPIGPAVDGWSRRELPTRTAIEGRYCRVEAIDVARHADDLFEAYMEAPDGRAWTYLSRERPERIEEFRAYLEALARSGDPLHHVIIDTAIRKPVGTAALMRIDPTHGVLEVGFITFSPRLQGTRVGTESMYLLMRRAFDELGYRRYEWKCDSLNAPSRSAAERYGFSFEGIFRQAIVYKERSRDTAWYAITSQDWPRVRAAFQTWLAPDNFDDQGRQKRRLADIRSEL